MYTSKSQKELLPLLLLAAIAVVLVGVYLFTRNQGAPAPVESTQAQRIQNDSDLNAAAKDLDSSNTTEVDTQLKQMSAEAPTF